MTATTGPDRVHATTVSLVPVAIGGDVPMTALIAENAKVMAHVSARAHGRVSTARGPSAPGRPVWANVQGEATASKQVPRLAGVLALSRGEARGAKSQNAPGIVQDTVSVVNHRSGERAHVNARKDGRRPRIVPYKRTHAQADAATTGSARRDRVRAPMGGGETPAARHCALMVARMLIMERVIHEQEDVSARHPLLALHAKMQHARATAPCTGHAARMGPVYAMMDTWETHAISTRVEMRALIGSA